MAIEAENLFQHHKGLSVREATTSAVVEVWEIARFRLVRTFGMGDHMYPAIRQYTPEQMGIASAPTQPL